MIRLGIMESNPTKYTLGVSSKVIDLMFACSTDMGVGATTLVPIRYPERADCQKVSDASDKPTTPIPISAAAERAIPPQRISSMTRTATNRAKSAAPHTATKAGLFSE